MNKNTCPIAKDLFETFEFNYFSLNSEIKNLIEINNDHKNNKNFHTDIFKEVQLISEYLEKNNCNFSIDCNANNDHKNNKNSHTGIFEELQLISEYLEKNNCNYSIDLNGNIVLNCDCNIINY